MNSLVFLATLALASCSPVEVVSSDLKAASPPTIGSYECPAAVAPATVVVSAPSDNHVHVPAAVVTTPVQVSAPHVSVVDQDHHHVHVAAPVVIAHEPHTHFDRNEIPQGPYLAPIPKKADTSFEKADTAFPTK